MFKESFTSIILKLTLFLGILHIWQLLKVEPFLLLYLLTGYCMTVWRLLISLHYFVPSHLNGFCRVGRVLQLVLLVRALPCLCQSQSYSSVGAMLIETFCVVFNLSLGCTDSQTWGFLKTTPELMI